MDGAEDLVQPDAVPHGEHRAFDRGVGVDDCLLAPASQNPDQVFTGRSHWISLLSEVLPRALLAELGLAKILIGSSGASQFLLV